MQNVVDITSPSFWRSCAERKSIIFVDYVNMPVRGEFGVQPPLELLRQLVDRGVFYERCDLLATRVADTAFFAAVGTSEGSHERLNPRFLRDFYLLCVPNPGSRVISRLFTVLLDDYFGEGNRRL